MAANSREARISSGQIREISEDFRFTDTGGEHFKDIFHPDAHAADARATAALLRIKSNAIQIFHVETLIEPELRVTDSGSLYYTYCLMLWICACR
jgi:hypothetical protein